MTLCILSFYNVPKIYANPLPSRLCIDSPQNNVNTRENHIDVVGWSLDSSGVAKVQVFVDNVYKGDAAVGLPRADVNKVFPGYSGGTNSGYKYTLDSSNLSNGSHTLTVKSMGKNGTTVQQSVKVTRGTLPSMMFIDTPRNNFNVNGNQINVAGWSLDASGINKVQIYLDNVYKRDAAIGVSRQDVNKVFPGYSGGANSGYNYTLNLSGVSNGKHTITVRSIGKSGTAIQQSIKINKVILTPLICIDTPQNNSSTNGNQVNVAGWSLDANGINKVQIYLDNVYKGDATIGISRQDVNKVFPGYSGGATSGYNYTLNLSGVSNGKHTVTVKSVGKNGATTQQNIGINKMPPPPLMCIDALPNNINIKNKSNINVVGWSLDASGVNKVQVYVDNVYKGDATIGTSRPDVDRIFPGYSGGANSGYRYNLDLMGLKDGGHTITVKSLGKSGTTIQQSTKINKITSPALIYIDYPSTYSSIKNNQINIAGWSLNAYGVKTVQIYVDNTYKGNASIGISRPDVNNVFPGYTGGVNSGYNYKFDAASIKNGVHTINIKSIGNDGNVSQQSTQIYKLSNNGQALSPLVDIDTPSNNMFVKSQNGSLNVVGWSLNAFGVKTVQIYVDDNYKGNANIGNSRTDVNNVFPGYAGGANSGYNYNLNLASMTDGVHTITVKSIGNDGVTTQQSNKVYKFSDSNQFTTNYNLSLSNMVDTQMSYGEPVMDSNGSWVNADKNTIQHYVDSMNFIDSYGIYEFLRLDYIQGVTVEDLNKILSGKGVLDGKGAQFLAAAKQSNVNPIYLVSHALLETGNGYSRLATGIDVSGKTVYNLFGIGAYDSNANYHGSMYAYTKGWFSVDQAIYGGAQWISSDYINNSKYKQNTLYKMRWNPASPANHQYATDVRWAYNQVSNIKRLTDMVQNPSLQFDIPQYK
jgi:beta-N-acetylglucosaminidase